MSLLSLDARWRRFNDPDRKCPCCGRQFSGVYDIAYDHPAQWPHPDRGNQPFVKVEQDQLTADLCRVGEHRLLRAVLSLPIHGADEAVHLSPWIEVPPSIFYAYLETLDDPDAPLPEATEAMLANDLPGVAEAPFPITLHFDSREALPRITAPDTSLDAATTQGISFDRLLDLYAACGDDIRPHLLRD